MKKTEIMRVQERIGTEPDVFWGPNSIAACHDHLRDLMPDPSPWPNQNVHSIEAFYGPHGTPEGYTPPMKKIKCPFPMYLYGDKNTPLRTISAHEKVADSLLSVLERIAEVYPTQEARIRAGVTCFDGVYNPRKMRGGSAWSMHSWAIAIDLDAGHNGNTTHWPTRAVMPIEVMECFALEGWTSAGAFWSRDAMHFQATQP